MPKYKSFAVKADGISADGGTITGYASTWDREPDSYGDVVAKGAFVDTLREWEQRDAHIPFLYGHRLDDPKYNIGWCEAEEDERGLKFTAHLDADSEKAQYVRKLYKEGRIYQFSFAFDVLDAAEVELEDGTKANELRKLDLYEISAVQIPANAHAEVVEVKAGRRNSKKDEDQLRAILEQLDAIRSTITDLIGEEDEPEDEPKAKAKADPTEDEDPEDDPEDTDEPDTDEPDPDEPTDADETDEPTEGDEDEDEEDLPKGREVDEATRLEAYRKALIGAFAN